MFDIDHTSKLNFCVVPYIYNEYMSSTVSMLATSVDTKIATCNLINTNYYEAGRKSQVFGH